MSLDVGGILLTFDGTAVFLKGSYERVVVIEHFPVIAK